MTPKEMNEGAKADQGIATLSDIIPEYVWGLYRGFQRRGFTQDQAFELTKMMSGPAIAGMISRGKRIKPQSQRKENEDIFEGVAERCPRCGALAYFPLNYVICLECLKKKVKADGSS